MTTDDEFAEYRAIYLAESKARRESIQKIYAHNDKLQKRAEHADRRWHEAREEIERLGARVREGDTLDDWERTAMEQSKIIATLTRERDTYREERDAAQALLRHTVAEDATTLGEWMDRVTVTETLAATLHKQRNAERARAEAAEARVAATDRRIAWARCQSFSVAEYNEGWSDALDEVERGDVPVNFAPAEAQEEI
jgi:hypothetical protein